MSLRFGTDGVRGEAYTQLTVDFVYALGVAAARVIGGDHYLIGRDTRESGPDFERALAKGLASGGASIGLLAVVPTPAVAWLSSADDVAGAMISASHNRFSDNGVKLFAEGGLKLSDEVQDQIQIELDVLLGEVTEPSAGVVATNATDDVSRYVDAVIASVDGRKFAGTTVVLDCANGSAAQIAPAVFEELGADVVAVATEPDGRNINDGCGSTHLEGLQAAVSEHAADFGFAFDGDADRMLAVDNLGSIVDGDQILAMCAVDLSSRGRLAGDTVVVTVMSNLGFRRAMAAVDIAVVDTKVGDRYVLEALDEGGYSLGGEQSGHVIFREVATTGDGLLSALQVTDLVLRSGRSFDDIAASSMVRFPQILENVQVVGRVSDLDVKLAPAIANAEAELGDDGRVLIRPSGTEPLIRVMVEADTAERAAAAATMLVEAVKALR
ncbi:MAG: phosphoglucosamine mutase [Acidimicrobiales bacterium]